ncbi:hypothetical protein VTO42DRAFT_7775 [Malbranchea cinnamomea]
MTLMVRAFIGTSRKPSSSEMSGGVLQYLAVLNGLYVTILSPIHVGDQGRLQDIGLDTIIRMQDKLHRLRSGSSVIPLSDFRNSRGIVARFKQQERVMEPHVLTGQEKEIALRRLSAMWILRGKGVPLALQDDFRSPSSPLTLLCYSPVRVIVEVQLRDHSHLPFQGDQLSLSDHPPGHKVVCIILGSEGQNHVTTPPSLVGYFMN